MCVCLVCRVLLCRGCNPRLSRVRRSLNPRAEESAQSLSRPGSPRAARRGCGAGHQPGDCAQRTCSVFPPYLHHSCTVRAPYFHKPSTVLTAYLHRTCTIPAPYLHEPSTVPATYLQRTCTVLPRTCTIPARYLHEPSTVSAAYLDSTCNVPAAYLHCTCTP